MSTRSKKITLKSSDEETFEVVARQSLLITNMIDYNSNCVDNVIPLPNVSNKILAKVIEYCKKYVEAENNTVAVNEELKDWDASFVMVDQDTIFGVMLAANFLNIKGLLELTCKTVAEMIMGKSPEEICKFFNIKNDHTPEEQEEIRKQYK